jgi:toxin ParE1/3/4
MQVRWSPRASAQLDAIFDYVAADNESAAVRQVRLILAATRQIGQFPECGRPSNARYARELAVPGTPYVILYTLHKDLVKLISIKHGARLR